MREGGRESGREREKEWERGRGRGGGVKDLPGGEVGGLGHLKVVGKHPPHVECVGEVEDAKVVLDGHLVGGWV